MRTKPRPAGSATPVPSLAKAPTGIRGVDEITGGGFPAGRPTLVCGGAGCGKTLLAMEFLVHGALKHGEPGVFVTFEETPTELAENFASLGVDLQALVAAKRLAVDHVFVERSEIEETGEYDLEGLFIRLGHSIDAIGARRVVLDTVEALFAGLPNPGILRAELRRLFRWLKERGVTAVITGERGEGTLTRHGLEEYVSDCVVVLDHRVTGQVSTRRLRVAKYRGSLHGTNEYPFLIEEGGITVLPVTSLTLNHEASGRRISSGVAGLDAMLGGEGFFRGSTVLVSGTAGCGKTSLAAHFADATCRRGERCLSFLFEESPGQMMRNMRSIGLQLEQWVTKGLLRFHATRPSFHGLEMHLAVMLKAIDEFRPSVVVIDPVSAFGAIAAEVEVKSLIMRLVDFLKVEQITALLTTLTTAGTALEHTDAQISSLIDTWLLLRDIESNGERNRGMYVLKSRGMVHSNQIREFLLTGRGVELTDVYVGPSGVLTGSARLTQEAREAAEELAARREIERQRAALERKRHAVESQIAGLRAQLAADEAEVTTLVREAEQRRDRALQDRDAMSRKRQADRPVAKHRRARRNEGVSG